MKKYNVNVNGTNYEVVIEEVNGAEIAAAAPVAAPAPAASAPAAPVAAGGETVTSPMPGNILAVNVTVGQAVKKGDVLMVLEAMKMENEIMAPIGGTIQSVSVTKGATVQSGSPLCVIA